MSKFYNIDLSKFPYEKVTYTGQYGPFDYLVIPKGEYNGDLVGKVHDMPMLLSEWWGFYRSRYAMVNKNEGAEFINLPIITRQECWDFGL